MCLKNGNEEPVYEITPNQTKVVFKSQVKDITVVEIDEGTMSKLNDRQKQFLKSGITNISRKEYSEFVKCSIRTAFNDLQELLEKEIIKKIGKGKYIRYTIR